MGSDVAAEIAAKTDAFLAAEITPYQARWANESGVSREVWLKAGSLSLVGVDIPRRYGGGGGDFRAFAALLEARARQDDRSWGITNQAIVMKYLLNHGTDGQREKYLPGLTSGRLIGAIAMTEPTAGSDLKAMRATATRDESKFTLTGVKSFISNVKNADVIVVAMKSESASGARGVSLFVVDLPDPNFRIIRHLPKIGQRGIDTSEIEFCDLVVDETALLGGAEGRGFAQMMSDLPYERMIVAVSAIATMERAVDLAIDYAKNREVFGKKLIELQHTRFTLAELKTQCVVGRAFVESCVEKLVKGELDTATASMAKLWLSESEFSIANRCLQIFGGNGYLSDYPISQIFIDARVEMIYAGTSEIMKEIISRSL